jgi:hypothetical protein
VLVAGAGRLAGGLYGGSPVGDRLIGAMLLIAPKLRLWHPNIERSEPVILIDGIIDGPSRLDYLGWTLRQAGASSVAAVVVEYLDHSPPIELDDFLNMARPSRVSA